MSHEQPCLRKSYHGQRSAAPLICARSGLTAQFCAQRPDRANLGERATSVNGANGARSRQSQNLFTGETVARCRQSQKWLPVVGNSWVKPLPVGGNQNLFACGYFPRKCTPNVWWRQTNAKTKLLRKPGWMMGG